MKYKQFIRVDEEGFEIEPVLVKIDENGKPIKLVSFEEDIDINEIIDYLAPSDSEMNNFYKKKWDFDNKKWVEGATQEEIEEFLRQSLNVPTLEKRLIALENAMLMALMK